MLQKLSMGLEAASILLFIMNSPGMSRTVISEDAIEAAIVLFRSHLSKNLLTSINQVGHITAAAGGAASAAATAAAGTPSTSAKKRRRSSAGTGDQGLLREMKKVYQALRSTVGWTVQIMERLETLVCKVPLEDQPLLNISSGALFALELDPVLQVDIGLSHQLHEATIPLITCIFRKYPRHRQILLEDLFPVMLKLPTSKKTMRTVPIQSSSILYPTGLKTLTSTLGSGGEPGYIQTIAALIMAMIQSAVIRPSIQMQQEEDAAEQPSQQQIQVVSGLSGCQSVSDFFVAHLLRRCSKKGQDGGASEFRPILFHLLEDFLMVLLVPEYPAADMLLLSLANGISKDLLEMVNGNKAASGVETTYLNTILEALGKICAAEARILKVQREEPVRVASAVDNLATENQGCYCGKTKERGIEYQCQRCKIIYHASCIGTSSSMILDNWYCDACQMGRIVDFERERNNNMGELGCPVDFLDGSYCMRRLLIDYLSITTRNSPLTGLKDAYEFQLARWLAEISKQALAQGDASMSAATSPWPLFSRLLELWDPRESSDLVTMGQNSLNGMLHCLSDEGRSRIMVHIASTQSQLLLSYRSQVGLLVNELLGNKKNAILRKLALKAIEKV